MAIHRPRRSRGAAVISAAILTAASLVGTSPAAADTEVHPEAHTDLDAALAAAGTTRAAFDAEADVADTLLRAESDISAMYPGAVADVRMRDGRGEIVLNSTCTDTPAACLAALQRGITPVVYDPAHPRIAERPEVRGAFTPAQSLGSLGSSTTGGDEETPDQPVTAALEPPLPAGSHYYAAETGAHCSLGVPATLNGTPVNITAGHCATDYSSGRYVGGDTVAADTAAAFGEFSAQHFNSAVDYIIITGNAAHGQRLATNLVAAPGHDPGTITGWQRPIAGQIACKSGWRSGITCGPVVGSATRYTYNVLQPETKTVYDMCVLSGDSGGVIFSGTKALGIVSESNATPYGSCAEAQATAAATNGIVSAVGVDLAAIIAREPQLEPTTTRLG